MNKPNYNNSSAMTVNKRDIIRHLYEEECNKIYDRVLRVSDAFYADLGNSIPMWISEIKCKNSISNIFKAKSQAEAFTSELVAQTTAKIQYKTEEWVKNRFIPLLKGEITTLADMMNTTAGNYMDELTRVRVTMDINQRDIVDKTTPSKTNRALSVGASLLVGDVGGAIMGGAGGIDATMKTIGCEIGAGVALGIISCFTPIGLPALVIGALASIFVGGNWALSSMEKKVRNTVAEKMAEKIKDPLNKERFNMMIISNVDKSLSELRHNANHQWGGLLSA